MWTGLWRPRRAQYDLRHHDRQADQDHAAEVYQTNAAPRSPRHIGELPDVAQSHREPMAANMNAVRFDQSPCCEASEEDEFIGKREKDSPGRSRRI